MLCPTFSGRFVPLADNERSNAALAGYCAYALTSVQNRRRNPTVGSTLLRWRKPKANPPFTCVNITPK